MGNSRQDYLRRSGFLRYTLISRYRNISNRLVPFSILLYQNTREGPSMGLDCISLALETAAELSHAALTHSLCIVVA